MKCPVCNKETDALITLSVHYSKQYANVGTTGYYCGNMCFECEKKFDNIIGMVLKAERRTKYEQLKEEFENENK